MGKGNQYGMWSKVAMRSDIDKEIRSYVALEKDVKREVERAQEKARDKSLWKSIVGTFLPLLLSFVIPGFATMSLAAQAAAYGGMTVGSNMLANELTGDIKELGIDTDDYAPGASAGKGGEEQYSGTVAQGGEAGWYWGTEGADAMVENIISINEAIDDANDYSFEEAASDFLISGLTYGVQHGMNNMGAGSSTPEQGWVTSDGSMSMEAPSYWDANVQGAWTPPPEGALYNTMYAPGAALPAGTDTINAWEGLWEPNLGAKVGYAGGLPQFSMPEGLMDSSNSWIDNTIKFNTYLDSFYSNPMTGGASGNRWNSMQNLGNIFQYMNQYANRDDQDNNSNPLAFDL